MILIFPASGLLKVLTGLLASKDIDVNNANCSSSAASAVDGPGASFDVNNNIDSSDLSPVNNNMSFTGPVTAENGGPNTFSDLNVNAFSGTASAPLNVNSSSKVTANASGASVNSNLKTVNTHCDSNIDANSSNETATATNTEDIHSISKTVDIVTTANSGVNVKILCESNIEVNSTSNKSAAETSCGNVHSVSKIVNVVATANSGDSTSNVNVDSETTENGGVDANMSNDKAIDKGTVDSGAPLNDDVDLNNIDMLPDNNLNDSTVVTEVLSSGRAGPVPGACEVFLNVDASLEAGLFSPERNSFLRSCADLIDPAIPTLLCGDFNAVWDHSKDRRWSSNDSTYHDSSASLHYLFSEACVFDVWRYLHPDTIAFSWTRHDGLLASRIDLFGCPLSWAHGVHACDFVPCPYSDHVAVVLGVSPPVQLFRGPGRWKLNSSILRDLDFSSNIESFWASWRRRKKDFRSIQLWWDRGKDRLKGLAIAFCSRKKALQEKERTLLVNLASHLKAKIDQGSVSFMDIYENVLARIADFYRLKAKGARVRARVQWAEEGEMSSRYFCRLEKKRGTEQWIAAIRGTDGKVATDIDGICRSWVDFFSTLFSADVLDLKIQEDLLKNLSVRLPSSSSASCDGPITLDEARKALEGAATGRSPGSDGLPAEFNLAFWKVLGEDLIEVFNASFSSGHLPPSLRRALITLLFKKGDRLDPKNWRPISLLNSDYKILARIVAGRLSKVLQLLIHPDQSCGVQGRYIGENIVLLNSVFQYSREASVPGALLSLDQEKAFDRVDHGFLFRIMSHVGFGSSFISWVKLLYSGISSAVCVNGYTSAAFFPSRGVRQGCPLSPHPLCFVY